MTQAEQGSSANIKDILQTGGIRSGFIEIMIDVLSHASTRDKLRDEFEARCITLGADQFFLPSFRILYSLNPQVSDRYPLN